MKNSLRRALSIVLALTMLLGLLVVPAAAAGGRKIDVWDLGGKVEEDDDIHTYQITTQTWLDKAAGGLFGTGGNKGKFHTAAEFGDLTFLAAADSDRFYTENEALADYRVDVKYNGLDFGDGYVTAGAAYCNGTGSATKRTLTVKNVKAGDTLVFYVGANNGTDMTFSLNGGDAVTAKAAGEKLAFVVTEDGDYTLAQTGGGKPVYYRVARIPAVAVSGKITLPADFPADQPFSLKFTNQDTKAVTEVELAAGATTYETALAPGYTYGIALSGVGGFGPTTGASGTKYVTPAEANVLAGQTHDITLEAKSTYTYSGTITGFDSGYDLSKLAVSMVPDADSAEQGSEPVGLTLTGMDFTATLEPGVNYTVSLAGVDDYQVKAPEAVTSEGAALTGQTIQVERKPVQAVSGKLVVLDEDDQFAPLYADSTYAALDAAVTDLTFAHLAWNEGSSAYEEDGYNYPAAVSGGGYTANLRAGAYLAKATVDGYATQTHVVVGDAAVEKDLLFVSTAKAATADYAADVYVGDEAQTPNFKTVTGALAYISRMTRTDDQRVTVHIAPGTYREQIAVETPNVTFVNADPSKDVTLTWYYGIGYTYYSATGVSGTESWYDPQLAFDRFTKPTMDVARWGATVRVRAAGFRAEGITFENSFNRYLTDEELADGVELAGTQSISAKREYGLDVTSKAATERAAAIWVDTNSGRGDKTEFKDCRFYSSQDTFGTGKRMYLKDCYLEGMTDFICGPGDVVFDTCVLNWKGYSDSATGGYLTAPQTAESEKGYLFRNCYVTGDSAGQVAAGAFGRPWGGANAAALFVNTKLASADLITAAGWAEMDGKKPADAKFGEYNTTLADGAAVDTTGRVIAPLAEAPAAAPEDYFGDWTPAYYTAEADGVALAAAPTIADNGDINLPRPGHTLTVSYTLTPEANNANDDSLIQWYRVADGAETLVKTSAASAEKTYQIQTEDVGARIKVTVTPRTIGGQTGAAMSATVAETVKEGYEDPSGKVDPELGDGVNIFLAGDSTVKDYSAAGMYMSGKPANEGSWGEFLQGFFNSDLVTVVNYANGGRSSRTFINDGNLDSIGASIKEGDYLFIQFGHNDCYEGDDRGVLLGEPDANGVYPSTPGEKGADGLYPAKSGTYKWYLQQYIDVALDHGATPVLMTPVSRMNYGGDGKITPHHDADSNPNKSNTYCAAVVQLYKENVAAGKNVVFMDNFTVTKDLFEVAYQAGGSDSYGKQIMGEGEKTHNNKLGGFIEAAMVAVGVQNAGLTISKAVQAPAQVRGATTDNTTVFSVDGKGALTAFDITTGYAQHAPYWEGLGQQMLNAIAAKAEELNQGGGEPTPPPTDEPTTPPSAEPSEAPSEQPSEQPSTQPTEPTATINGKTEMSRGSTQVLTVTVANGEKDSVYWTSDDASVLTVAQTGKVTAEKAGTATVTAAVTLKDGTVLTATIDITVKAGVAGGTGTGGTGGGSTGGTGSTGNGNGTTGGNTGATTTPTTFADVPATGWFAAAVETVAEKGLMKGVGNGVFAPEASMTRAMLMTVLARLDGQETDGGAAWYSKGMDWAMAQGISDGTMPEASITREQMAAMLYRYAGSPAVDAAMGMAGFADVDAVSDWANDAVRWAVQQGLLTGKDGARLDPQGTATRAEVAAILARFIEKR